MRTSTDVNRTKHACSWRSLSLREHAGATARLLGRFDAGDVETIVRTLQAIAERAAWEAAQE